MEFSRRLGLEPRRPSRRDYLWQLYRQQFDGPTASCDALAVVQAAVSLTRSHPHAPALDVLDLVMRGRADQVLDFNDPAAPNGSLAAPNTPFGQLLAAAFDEAITASSLCAAALTVGFRLDPGIRLLKLASRNRSWPSAR